MFKLILSATAGALILGSATVVAGTNRPPSIDSGSADSGSASAYEAEIPIITNAI